MAVISASAAIGIRGCGAYTHARWFVELFSPSEGCSSCLLATIYCRENGASNSPIANVEVIALEEHVDLLE